MAAVVIRENAKAQWAGMASVRAKACDMVRRAVDYTASNTTTAAKYINTATYCSARIKDRLTLTE